MVEPTGVIGLIGLFTTCLEGYRICLSMSDANESARLLRTRMLVERERFLNVGRACGLLQKEESQRTEWLQQFLEEDPFRKRVINDTLEHIAILLGKAEDLDRKYAVQHRVPDAVKDKKDTTDSWAEMVLRFRTSLNKVSWSIRDQPAYGDLLRHLEGFNTALESILPSPTQQFLKTVLPATVCSTTEDEELPSLQDVPIGHAFLQSQVEWSRAVNGVSATPRGPQIDIKSIIPNEQSMRKDRKRYLAGNAAHQTFLIEWLPWHNVSQDLDEREDRIRKVSGLLGGEKSQELRLFSCAGYLEQTEYRIGKQRFALVYELGFKPARCKSLLDLLTTFSKVQLPPLEARVNLARLLCRSMLLYHSSSWIHHDFRSYNVIFIGGSSGIDGKVSKVFGFEGVDLSAPFIVGFGHARDETDESLMLADKKAAGKMLSEHKRYWSPNYLSSSKAMRTERSFQREHDIYSLGCVLLEIGVWKPLESYSWSSEYENSHRAWHARLLREEGKLRALCGSRYAEAVMTCLRWSIANVSVTGDVQSLAFDILLKLEEIVL